MKSTIRNRIEQLEILLRPKSALPWDRIYDALKEVDRCTCPGSPDTDFEKDFVARNGTRENFIQQKLNQFRKEKNDVISTPEN